jgi:diguanylate cyclase (GGDEF)-like protein
LPAAFILLLLTVAHIVLLTRQMRKKRDDALKLRVQHQELIVLYQKLEAVEAELRNKYNAVSDIAYRDLLTNLPNRGALEKAAAEGTWKEISALILIDIDRFKIINDVYGHTFGDRVLAAFSEKLKKVASDEGLILARLVSDEFAALPASPVGRERAGELAVRIFDCFNEPLLVDSSLIRISLSCGIAIAENRLSDLDLLFKNAYLALNKAKKLGRGKYLLFENTMMAELSEKLSIEEKLQLALDRNEFRLHFQPQFNIESKKICGLEALVRWNDPEQGLRYPNDFIQIAEETGQILFIGEIVLREACRFESRIVKEFGTMIPLSVNVSCHQLGQQDFVEFFRNVTSEFDLKPEYLSIEITESTLIDSFDDSFEKIMKLKELGIGIHLDDFGKGYSSLNYIRNLPIDVVKIDKDFIHDLGESQADTLIESIITMVHKMGKGIIAEGVENQDQWNKLTAFGCETAQGYLMGKPAPEETIVALLRAGLSGAD